MAKRSKKRKAANGEVSAKAAATDPLDPRTPSWFSRDWVWGVILVLAVIVTYAPVWQAGFIWDDDQHITRPELLSWAGLGRIWFEVGATQQYYPLVHSLFWVEHGLWGDGPLGYHLVNVLLYALSALLLFKILRRLEVPGAWLATAIFALHPVQVESVAWVTELKNILSGVFYFGAALAYLKFDRTRKTNAYVAALVLFVLGLLSKSVIATLPAALLVVFWWKRGKVSWKQDVLPLAPFFVVGMAGGLFTAWVERHFIGAEGAEYTYTIIERGLIAGHAIWFYLSKLVWPADLIFIYPRWEISQAVGWQYLFPAAALLLAGMLGWLSRWWRGPLAGFLFFAGTLFPALGFFNVYPFRYSFVADHFQYLACLGIIVPCAAGMALLADSVIPRKPWLQSSLGAGLLLVLGVLSWQRAWVYENVETLWTDTIAKDPNCWMAHNNLGHVFLKKEQLDVALAEFQKALTINPNYAEAHNNLGDVFSQKGRLDVAMAEFRKALAINPNYAEAYNNLGVAFSQKGQLDVAMAEFQKALAINPNYAEAHHNLGVTLLQKRQMDAAVAEFQKALEINPNYAKAHNNLGVALEQMGQVDAAMVQFQKAVETDPNDAEAHSNLGIALSRKGRMDEAIAQFQEVVRLKPGDGPAQDNLAKAQAMARQRTPQKVKALPPADRTEMRLTEKRRVKSNSNELRLIVGRQHASFSAIRRGQRDQGRFQIGVEALQPPGGSGRSDPDGRATSPVSRTPELNL